jgi:hypothetical protein
MTRGRSASASGAAAPVSFGCTSKSAFCAQKAMGATVAVTVPTARLNPACSDVVTPRPAHTGPSLTPYGKLELNTVRTLTPCACALTSRSGSAEKEYRADQGWALSGAIRRTSFGERARIDHG